MSRFIHRPSPALFVALLALFMALGGTGYAATPVSAGQREREGREEEEEEDGEGSSGPSGS